MSNVQTFRALYTKQKTQKAKKWADGFVKISGTRVWNLFLPPNKLVLMHFTADHSGWESEGNW